jgi:glycerol-3-phosphate dehydrogenase (NAD(P)+)
MVAVRVPTTIWARRASVADHITRRHRNRDYMVGLELPRSLRATADIEEALDGADVVIMAVPSHGFRAILSAATPHLAVGAPVVSLTKGVEQETLKRMTEVIVEAAPGHPYAVLTGPNLCEEVALGFPTASVVAAAGPEGVDDALAAALQRLLSTETFRVYTNPDLTGCELAGSVKNVMAIACGIADGMGFGDNTRATLITRGLAEIRRLGVALGGDPLTFSGLAGMGDLVATCMSRRSRNRWVGEQLGRGRAIDDIIAETRMVAEGVRSSSAVLELARRAGVDTPIASEVVAVIHDGKSATDGLASLMQRVMKPELHGIGAIPPEGAPAPSSTPSGS